VICIQCSNSLGAGVRVCPACHALQHVPVHVGPIGPGATKDLGHGRVVVQARIGEGGMGVVWRAWLFHAPDGPRGKGPPVPLALKVLRMRGDELPGVRALFSNEADALKCLHHPNIVAFHDFFEWDGALALAMELVEGSTLEDLESRHRARAKIAGAGSPGGIPVARAWYYFQQLLGALAATHALGIVHRDVKPSNVLIRGDGIVKLSDYGIARLACDVRVNPAAAGTPLEAQPLAAGTGAYMSPEQVLSRGVDARSDLYSAAIVFYEMLAGRPPFSPDEKNEFSLRQDQVESPPPPLLGFAPEAPAALEPLFARAMAKAPEYRFASAIEMGETIRLALGERETPEWRAQREIADQAKAPLGEQEGAHSVRAAKLKTLREFVVSGYQASNPTR
jgi:serine/threonine protein kinase